MIKTLSVLMTCALVSFSSAAVADVKKGKRVFKKCKACHTVKEGEHKIGPSLFKILGEPAGQAQGFEYSNAFEAIDIIWDDETFKSFVLKPKDIIPDSKMAFAGLKKEQDADNLIDYLRDVSADK